MVALGVPRQLVQALGDAGGRDGDVAPEAGDLAVPPGLVVVEGVGGVEGVPADREVGEGVEGVGGAEVDEGAVWGGGRVGVDLGEGS